MVQREYERMAPTIEGFCGCEMCRDDVLVYTLNRVKPHYVSQPKGEVLSRIELQADQGTADVSVVLMNAFRRVNNNPRAGHP